LETTIDDLGYTRNKRVLHELNNYPILATHAHTRPFGRKWLNIISGLLLPLGIFFYFRMLRFRFRLYRDLKEINNTSNRLLPLIQELAEKQKDTLVDETYKDYTKLEIQQNDGDNQAEQDK